MKISKQARRDAKQLFRCCLPGGVLDENRVRQAVAKVLEAKPRRYLAILSHFQRLLKLDREQRTARIESVIPLPEDVRAQLETTLARRYGPGLAVTFTLNPTLLGGLRIRVGSDVYDGSVRARLAALAESF